MTDDMFVGDDEALDVDGVMLDADDAMFVSDDPMDYRFDNRAIVNQTNIGTVSKATLGKPLRDGVERIWAFLSTYIPS